MSHMDEALGRAAYEAYRSRTGGKPLATGAEIPMWDALSPDMKNVWMDAALATVREEAELKGQ